MQNRNLQLSIISSDLYNLFRSINIPVVILSDNLQIRRFNPAAESVFNLINTDVGRPITNINTNFDNSDLEQAIREVINTHINKEYEMQDRFGCWYAVQIRPYKTTDNRLDGVVITFIDINAIKKSLVISKEALEYAEAIIDTVREPLLVLDANLHVEKANKTFYQTFMVTPEEALNKSIFDLGNGQWNITSLRDLLDNTLRACSKSLIL